MAALEKAAHEFSADFQKYNQKMRQLTFNLKVAIMGSYSSSCAGGCSFFTGYYILCCSSSLDLFLYLTFALV